MDKTPFAVDECPWQRMTAASGLALTHRLDRTFDADRLQQETTALFEKYQSKEQHGPYHDGGWKGICLHAANGDYKETALVDGTVYSKTEVLVDAPYLESIIDSLDCDMRRVRLMGLEPGEYIYWHVDSGDSLDAVTTRLHIPIFTDENVRFQISHKNCVWQAGEFWYGDFSFPHRVYNGGTRSRVHLILDLMVDERVESLFPAEYVQQRESRIALKQNVMRAFHYRNPIQRATSLLKAFIDRVTSSGSRNK